MRMVILSLSIGMLVSCGRGNIAAENVPSLVRNSVLQQYPDAVEMEWNRKDSLFEAEITTRDHTEEHVLLGSMGNLLVRKSELALTAVPQAILEAVNRRYSTYRIDEAEQVQRNGKVYYQVELEKRGKKDVKLVLDENGEEEKQVPYWN